ncbi:phage tail protein, partial [Acinetobacter brisouii]|uniref:phage tail protein n=1 Tax=Acinetobacter brisouii TaxID=396323 RepID=UPI0005F8400E
MGKKKKQTVGYKYFAYGHFVLCHGPIDSITRIRFQDKDAYTNAESANKRIYINKPSLFGGDEQSGGIQGNVDLLFGYPDQQKNSVIAYITDTSTSALTATDKFSAISILFPNILNNASTALISAWRGVTSVVFDNLYIGTSPTLPDSKWRVKRVHTLQDGQPQWYDEKAEINPVMYYFSPNETAWKYKSVPRTDSTNYVNAEKGAWSKGSSPFGDKEFGAPGAYNFPTTPATVIDQQTILWAETSIDIDSVDQDFVFESYLDNGITVWVNGTQVLTNYDANAHYLNTTIDASHFNVGANRITIKCVDDALGVRPGNWIWFDLRLKGSAAKEADINPAHIIRECLTNTLWGKGAITGLIDEVSFKACADTLYNENMGMSIVWSDSTSIKEFIDNVLEHINGELYVDRITNLWTLKLIRDDYHVQDLIHLTESHYKSLTFERKTLAECINQVTVTYYDRERAKDSTITIQDVARIAQQGGVISQNVEYKGFTNSSIASRVALRDLKTLSSELASIEFDLPESIAENWHKAYVFKLSNSRYGLSEAVFRVTEIKFGDGVDNTVSIKAIEDSFSSPMQSVVEYIPPVKSDISAKDATAITFEVPYIELVEQYGQDEIDAKLANNPDLSFVGMAAVRPNNYHINASLYSNAGAGYAEEVTLDFCPSATLKNTIGYLDTAFEVENVAEFDLLKVNDRIQLDDELMAFVSFDATTHILMVKRGVADTVPAKHTANARIYGWDNYSGLDSTEYLSGETVAMKALTLTGSDILELSEATAHSITCSARAIRPYVPANVQINGEYFPAEIETDLILTWVDRNRVQQTGGTPLAWTDSGVTIEIGTTYQLILTERDENEVELRTQNLSLGTLNTYTFSTSAMNSNTRTIEIMNSHQNS